MQDLLDDVVWLLMHSKEQKWAARSIEESHYYSDGPGEAILVSCHHYHWTTLSKSQTCSSCKTAQELTLEAFCHEEWATLSLHKIKSLIENYNKRLEAVINVKVGNTQYEELG